ncbi:hypothetical protein Pfo_020051 [Paulownia fortunei]|nr:hypothetical protein Pfo_020051 [Paulownia fortunei]
MSCIWYKESGSSFHSNEPSISLQTVRENKISCPRTDQTASRQVSGIGSTHERAARAVNSIFESVGIASRLNSKDPKIVTVFSASFSFTYEIGPGAHVAYVDKFSMAFSHFSALISFLRALPITATVRGW